MLNGGLLRYGSSMKSNGSSPNSSSKAATFRRRLCKASERVMAPNGREDMRGSRRAGWKSSDVDALSARWLPSSRCWTLKIILEKGVPVLDPG